MSLLHCTSLFLWAVLFHFPPPSSAERPYEDALFLTPYIESGRIREAQQLAKVPPMLKGSEGFAGYLTVNKSCNSNIFFWLHKSQQGHWEDRPLLVWLEGGFGSSMIGMFEEIGPFTVREKKHAKNNKTVHRRTRKTSTGSACGTRCKTLKEREELKTRSREVHEESEADLRVDSAEAESVSRKVRDETATDLRVDSAEAESALREVREGKEIDLRKDSVEEESASREVREGKESDLRVDSAEAESASREVREGKETDLRVDSADTKSPSREVREGKETESRVEGAKAESASQNVHEELETGLWVRDMETNTASPEGRLGPKIQRSKYAWNEDLQLQRRKYAWNRKYNLVFIDSPVGVGFSFTESDSGYAKNIADSTRDFLDALTQLYKLFPALQKNKLFFLGSCFGGKLAVVAAHKLYKLHQASTTSDKRHVVPVPAGLIELAAALEPFHVMRDGVRLYLNNVGLLDQQQLREFTSREHEVRAAVRAGNHTEAFRLWFKGLERVKDLTGFRHVLDITRDYFGSGSNMPALRFVNQTEVRRAIHVGNYEINYKGDTAKSHMVPGFLQSVKSELEELLTKEPFPVVFFTGQLDIMATYTMASDLFTSLEWPYAMDFYKARRCQFRVGNRVAAYYKTAGGLTDVLVRNVGHWIASAQPRWTYEMMETFLDDKTAFQCI